MRLSVCGIHVSYMAQKMQDLQGSSSTGLLSPSLYKPHSPAPSPPVAQSPHTAVLGLLVRQGSPGDQLNVISDTSSHLGWFAPREHCLGTSVVVMTGGVPGIKGVGARDAA